jgi:hypothetical protein
MTENVEDTEVLDTPEIGYIAPSEPIEAVEASVSFDEYTQEISEDLVVTTYGDGVIVDQSGPFDSAENAQAFGTSLLDALSDESLKLSPLAQRA